MVVQEITDPLCDNYISGTTSVDFLAISSIIQSYDTDFQMISLKLTEAEAKYVRPAELGRFSQAREFAPSHLPMRGSRGVRAVLEP